MAKFGPKVKKNRFYIPNVFVRNLQRFGFGGEYFYILGKRDEYCIRFSHFWNCPNVSAGDKMGIEKPSEAKGKNEKRAPSASVALGSVGCPNREWVTHKHFKKVQKISLGEETQEIYKANLAFFPYLRTLFQEFWLKIILLTLCYELLIISLDSNPAFQP